MSAIDDDLKTIRKKFDFLFDNGFEIAGIEGGGMEWVNGLTKT